MLLLLLLLPVLLVSPVPAPAAVPDPGAGGAAPRVVVLDLRDTIQPASLRYLERGLRRAAEEGAALVVIELDTPGGLLTSLRSMTSAILASEVPVAVHVAPSGARAASAGFFLLLAADVAAMAPGTSTGAAHPVAIGQQQQRDQEQPDPSLDKAAKDAAALARSLAEGRGRSTAWAEKAVLESAAYSADEARAHRLIDLIAVDRGALLEALHGRTITRFDGSTRTLDLRGAAQVALGRTFAERLLTVIADPQIAYLLLMVGAIGLLIELTNPGAIVPGVAGALALLLGIYGLSILPVSVVGGLLIAAGLGLLAAEVFAASYGLLAVAGIASFVVGSLMLVDAPIPELRIGPAVVVPAAAVLAGLTAFLAVRAVRSRRLRPRSGVEAMIGAPGEVIEAITPGPGGTVFVHGERWDALSAQPLPVGTPVRVDALDGLRLWVSPAPAPQEPREPRDRGGSS
ncbi:MAG TPA: nodulation protein NfeD [Kofleriaceae bacterium]|nr:nodulation protein NfeD [Kofleriaceae bacterium]